MLTKKEYNDCMVGKKREKAQKTATKKHRRQFCCVIKSFGGFPEILEIMALYFIITPYTYIRYFIYPRILE